jgi:hypothetical protein
MKTINTLPILDFLEKARVAIKTNQKNLTLTIKEVTDLQNSISVAMTALSGKLSEEIPKSENNITVKINGGQF